MEEAPAAPQPAPASAAGPQQQTSPLLRCLSQLNDDVLATYLLPKLVERRSGAVVLTCSQLRALCQHSIQHLDLSMPQLQDADNPCYSPEVARQLVAAFPQCTSLAFALKSSSMASVQHSISTLLAGLPNLNTISIHDAGNHNPGAMLDPVLCQLHMHATALRCLCLHLDTSWRENCDMTWASLGKLAALTRLQLSFGDQVSYPCTQLNLRHLTGQTQLQSLRIQAPGAEDSDCSTDAALRQLAVEQFPGRLTALTELQLPFEVLLGISSISSCVNLRDLQLRAATSESYCMCPEAWVAKEWAALMQLTRLTRLHFDLDHDYAGAEDAFFAVVKRLPELRAVGAYGWNSSALPLLQSLTHLTAVHGAWSEEMDSAVDVSGFVCPHIRELGEAHGSPPFQAFPNLVCFSYRWLTADGCQSLSRHCTGLQKVAMAGSPPYMWDDGDEAAHIAALRSLAHLKRLTHLEIAPESDAELSTFTSTAAAGVGFSQLQYLKVMSTRHWQLSMFALMQLPGVCGLEELCVQLKHSSKDFSATAVRAWLVGLSVVPKVSLVLCSEEQLGVVESAKQWAMQRGLPLPAILRVSVVHDAA